MKSVDWLKIPGYGQRGVDILADLAAVESERVKGAANLLHEFIRAETAEALKVALLGLQGQGKAGGLRCMRCRELLTWGLCRDCSDDKSNTTVRLRLEEYKSTFPKAQRAEGLRGAFVACVRWIASHKSTGGTWFPLIEEAEAEAKRLYPEAEAKAAAPTEKENTNG